MLTLIYRLMILFITILIIRDMFKEEDSWNQVTGAIVIIPFILRMLMIK